MRRLAIGFIPLTDAAVLIAAAELGFATTEGLEIDLHREVSWANIRDKVNVGLLDGAHILAPLAIASSLGLGHVRVPLVAPFALNLNGSAITLAHPIYEAMEATGHDLSSGLGVAQALGEVVRARAAQGHDPLTFSTVYTFSTHTYMLRHVLAAGGLDPDRDVRLVVVPPPFTVESLRSGLIHGFCVGSPWNAVAVEAGVGRIALLGPEIFGWAPEKVLGVHARFAEAEPDVLRRLVRALHAAALWSEAAANRAELAHLLSAPAFLGLPAEVLARMLEGRLNTTQAGLPRENPDFLVLHRDGANRPDARHAAWIYAQMVRAGQTTYSPDDAREAGAVYRADVYDDALGIAPAGSSVGDPVKTCFGEAFRPEDLADYLARVKPA
ncbi:CmpA/NrtA family ABC transporter substrate-binding protein [Ancylobacter amanitiformis]|uniref:NitT/TauT family transport system ATP-binding protein n=1 Tax=Ancylobacter amanitiformis TaxID=217069 RepID=A0ABU0LTR7_9HYPH|nr:CmpA/NrtA family ABC transporter substrate-binding protein [Ancylobacter amanitiformis]MDQ0512106.1 NitT/TauT family transport system ATP-binding protein [Ancylobacter amanitiformis]